MAKRVECPRCGAQVELYGGDDRIRAHQAESEGQSCWAGGKRYADMQEAIRVHRERQQIAIQRAAELSE